MSNRQYYDFRASLDLDVTSVEAADGKLKIKTVSETAEIKNLSDHSDLQRDNHEGGNASGSESDDGSESKISNSALNAPNNESDVVTNDEAAVSNKASELQTESEQSKQLSNNCTQCNDTPFATLLHDIDQNCTVVKIPKLFRK